MKISSLKLIAFFCLALIMTFCKKNYVISDRQAILFELDHVNYGSEYQHSGFIIDSDGNVLTYNNPDHWNFPDRDLRISESQVTENLASCTSSGIKIPRGDLLKYSNHIKNIAATKVTAVKSQPDETGSTEYICYQFSENTGIYKGTILRMEGGNTCENLNFFSKKIADWMRDINNSLAEK